MDSNKLTNKVKTSESTISMMLGIVVVIVVGILLFNYFKGSATKSTPENKENIESGQNTEQSKPLKELPATYIVKANDNLWNISMEFFGSGYNWIDISKANSLKNPSVLLVGQTLTIPDVEVRQPVSKIVASKDPQTITGNSYTIVKGDNLWNISVRAYQDGFKWSEIAKANNIVNPNIIHVGNVLTIPR